MKKLSKLMLQAMTPVLSFAMVHQSIAAQQLSAPQSWQAVTDVKPVKTASKDPSRVFIPEKGMSGKQRYIVRFSDEPLATYTGKVAGLAATAVTEKKLAGKRSAAKLNAESVESLAYLGYLDGQQAKMESQMAKRLGRDLKIDHRFKAAVNAMTVTMTQDEAMELAKMPGIEFIQRDRVMQLDTDRGPTYVGAPAIWNGLVGGLEAKGEGIVVGIMDSGIHGDHPSFAEVGGDGYEHINPLGDGVFLGECDPNSEFFDETITCNNKLIGRYYFMPEEGNSEDTNGHGTHVASTAAGNFVTAPVLDAEGNPAGLDLDIAGVAPHANIVALQVCNDGCPDSARIAAINQIILDGIVDVVNHSIGSRDPIPASSPWDDAMDLAFLSARAAGITVANSSGNNGPEPSTLGGSGAPWMMNSAAFTHDRSIPVKTLSDFTGGESDLDTLSGRGITSGYGPAEIVLAADFSNGDENPEQCLTSFPEDTWTNGEIVVCDRGEIARVDKCKHVRDGGAAGCILTNIDDGATSVVNDAHVIPAIHMDAASGNSLKAWLETGSDHMGTISSNTDSWGVDPAAGSIAADFTSRGPNLAQDYLPISVAAPGVDIYAAMEDGTEYGFNSGTSMSSPHSAGAAALLKQVRPDWTDAEILSALATTANSTALKEDGETPADPFDMGSGMIRVDLAAEASLLLDETAANFEAAEPAIGGDPKTLNVAGLLTHTCLISCSWTRTVEATVDGSWTVTTTSDNVTVTPETFELSAGETQTLTITGSTEGLATDAWAFSEIVMTPAGDFPVQHLTLAYLPSSGSVPSSIDIEASRSADSYLVTDLSSIEITDLQIAVTGLAKASTTSFSLEGDSVNDSPYDDLTDGVGFTLISVPEDATLLNAFTQDATSEPSDVDLFVGFDANGNGIPEESEQVCRSATATAQEFCEIAAPDAGTWWIAVQNWAPTEDTPDTIVLSSTVVLGDEGNLTVEAPASVPELESFDIRLIWDLDGETGDNFFGSITLGSDAANPDNIGTIPVAITIGESDVIFTVDSETALPGDTLTFTGTVDLNFTPEDRDYTIAAEIPEGFSLVEESVTGAAVISGNTLTWEIAQPSSSDPEPSYSYTTSLETPACAMPFANKGAYIDLEALGIFPDTTITGDDVAFTAFSAQNFNFFGETFTGGFNFTDDGFVSFNSEFGPNPWFNTAIPTATGPNSLIAGLWRDMVIPEPSDEPGSVVGVSLASAGPDLTLIEYDNVKLFPGTGKGSVDFQIAIRGFSDDSPGAYEIMMAYDNILELSELGTVGVENATGTAGTQVFFNDVAITNEMAICFDLVAPVIEPTVISYQVIVDESATDTEVTTEFTHSVSSPGSVEVSDSITVMVDGEVPPVDYEGYFRGPIADGREITIGAKPPITLILTEMGEQTVEPTVMLQVVAPDGTIVRSRPLGKNLKRTSYVTRIRTASLAAGEYTVLALINDEPIAEATMILVPASP